MSSFLIFTGFVHLHNTKVHPLVSMPSVSYSIAHYFAHVRLFPVLPYIFLPPTIPISHGTVRLRRRLSSVHSLKMWSSQVFRCDPPPYPSPVPLRLLRLFTYRLLSLLTIWCYEFGLLMSDCSESTKNCLCYAFVISCK